MSKGGGHGHGVSGYTHTQAQLDDYANQLQVAYLSGEYKDPNEHLQKAVKSALENVVSFEEAAEGTERTQMKSFLSRVSSDLYKPCSTHLAFLDELLEGGIPQSDINACHGSFCNRKDRLVSTDGRSDSRIKAKGCLCQLRNEQRAALGARF